MGSSVFARTAPQACCCAVSHCFAVQHLATCSNHVVRTWPPPVSLPLASLLNAAYVQRDAYTFCLMIDTSRWSWMQMDAEDSFSPYTQSACLHTNRTATTYGPMVNMALPSINQCIQLTSLLSSTPFGYGTRSGICQRKAQFMQGFNSMQGVCVHIMSMQHCQCCRRRHTREHVKASLRCQKPDCSAALTCTSTRRIDMAGMQPMQLPCGTLYRLRS